MGGSTLRTEEERAQGMWTGLRSVGRFTCSPFIFAESGMTERLNTTNSCFYSDFTHLEGPEPGSPDPKLSSFTFSGCLDFLATVERISMDPFNPHTTFNYFSCF